MNKEYTLESIQNIRKYHLNEMDKISAMIEGKKVENPTPLQRTECDFGKWLYADSDYLKMILGTLFFSNIETLHARWHTEYTKIFQMFYSDKKKGLFSKILGAPKIDALELDKAKLYFLELQTTTDELLKMLGSCERKVQAMSENKFH